MNELIEDLLRFSRAANVELHKESVNLSDLVREMAQVLQAESPDRSAEFIIEPDLVATGDRTLLTTVMDNLLSNAWKYTSKKPHTRIAFGVFYEEGQRIFFIKDNGVGFDMAEADRLFLPFSRLPPKHEYPGTGIGLASVQRIITRHGGRVWTRAQPDQGAIFFFTLPDA